MKYLLIALFVIAPFASADEPVRERIEWIDIWVTDADKDALPRVLLVGDSITRGYFGAVEKHLAGKAYCARLTTSKCVSDPTFNDDLKLMLKQYKFSVIHFNNGLHGWGYTEEQYREHPCCCDDTFLANLKYYFAFENVEAFFLSTVDMRGWSAARRHNRFPHGIFAVRIFACRHETVHVPNDGNGTTFIWFTDCRGVVRSHELPRCM